MKVTGCTVHFVDQGVDTGPIIAQSAVVVHEDDDEESLRARILAEEHRLLPAVVRAIAERRVVIEDRKVRILGVAPSADVLRSLSGEGFHTSREGSRSKLALPHAIVRSLMDTNFYDVIVCGGETSGLCAAALLARRGFRVMVLGHEPSSAAFDADGVTLSAAPALLPPLDETPTARVLKELDVTALVKRKTATSEISFRLALPGQRLDLMRDPAAQERELGRAFGAAGGSVGTVIERLRDAARLLDPLFASAITIPPNGFWERREVGRLRSLLPKPTTDLFAPLPSEHPFRVMAASPAVHGAALVAHDVGPICEARAFEIARRGQPTFEGGLAGLQAMFWSRLETFGAERREHVTPVEVVVRRGRVAGVRVRPRDETIGCHHLLWAGSAAALGAALAPDVVAPHKRPPAARVTGYRYSVAALVEPEALPADMPSRTLAIGDPSRPLTEDNAVAITVGPPMARDSRRIPIWVECGVPAHLVEAGPSYLRALRGRVTHVLRRLLPGFAQHFVVLGSPYDGLPAEHRGTPAPETTPPASLPALSPPALVSPPAQRPLDIIGLPARDRGEASLPGRPREPARPRPGRRADLRLGRGAAGELGPGAQAPVAAPDPDQRVTSRNRAAPSSLVAIDWTALVTAHEPRRIRTVDAIGLLQCRRRSRAYSSAATWRSDTVRDLWTVDRFRSWHRSWWRDVRPPRAESLTS